MQVSYNEGLPPTNLLALGDLEVRLARCHCLVLSVGLQLYVDFFRRAVVDYTTATFAQERHLRRSFNP